MWGRGVGGAQHLNRKYNYIFVFETSSDLEMAYHKIAQLQLHNVLAITGVHLIINEFLKENYSNYQHSKM